jgi:hypothetical protein
MGPLYLNDPKYNDAALAELRNAAYQQFHCMTGGNMRDKRASLEKKANLNETDEERERRIALLREQITGLRLTAAKKTLIDEIEQNIMAYNEDFLKSVGQIMKQEFDPGSSWELIEAEDGSSKLIRQEIAVDAGPEPVSKHAYAVGMPLCIWSSVLPEDVVIREQVGEHRYKVQSEISGRVFEVGEKDLYDPNMEDGLFEDNPVGVAEVANLF